MAEFNPKKKEEQIMKFWKKKKIVAKVRKLRKGKKKFYFVDGPPYATGYIHMGTALNKILKDTYIRFFRMNGLDVWDQPGYDTHGLPIENKVEKKLGFNSKDDIERIGIRTFNKECKKFATQFIDVMNGQFENLGVWMDWSNPYLTLSNEYIEGTWATFKEAFEKGFLYRDRYSVHVCPRCETVVAYNEIEYKQVTDPSIYVKFPVAGKKNEFLLIWTTTPWTIPSNTGIMAKPNADYVYVVVGKETLILAKELLIDVMRKAGVKQFKIVKSVKGKKLEGLKYDHPFADIFPFLRNLKNAHRVVMSNQFVTLDEGTGLVHTAPGHGQEDYKVGIENDLPIISPLKLNGTFDESCGEYAGRFVKEADDDLLEELQKRGMLLHQEQLTHDYPMCWRCNSPLLFMAIPQWFFKVTKIRKKLIAENKKVNWSPDWAGKRFHDWLQALGDWPISRQRYWGIPLPIWVCKKCDKVKVIGSRKELPKVPKDFHRPFIDKVTLKCKCKGKMKRVPDVLDVWFDSGVCSWASLGYPKSKKLWKRLWPSDLNIEGPDQIRGWWNSEIITSVITFNKAPFKSILFHGFVLDAHGTKMSKSKGNIVNPEEVIDKYGRDVLRFYLLSSAAWDDFYFNWTDSENVARTFNVLRNTFQFVKTYAKRVRKPSRLEKEDKWILSKLNSLVEGSNESFRELRGHEAVQGLRDFVLNDFSRWYIKLVRDRTWPTYRGKDKAAAFYTLAKVCEGLVKLLAPIAPFFAEEAYQEIVKPLLGGKASVHMCDYPKPQKRLINKPLEMDMEAVKKITEASLAARQRVGLKLRWPAKGIVIVGANTAARKAVKNLRGVLLKAANVKDISIKSKAPEGDFAAVETGFGEVFLDLSVDKNIFKERLYNELTRKIQGMRKKGKLVVRDKIKLTLKSDRGTEKLLRGFVASLKKDVGAKSVKIGKLAGKQKDKLELESRMVDVAFRKTK